jgi:hypothetical protein
VPPDSEDDYDEEPAEEVLVTSLGEGLVKRGGKSSAQSAPYRPPPSAARNEVVIENGAFEPDF